MANNDALADRLIGPHGILSGVKGNALETDFTSVRYDQQEFSDPYVTLDKL
jgi:hypothetical protein